MAKSGTPYELFVQKIQQAIIDAEKYLQYKNIKVEHDCKLIDTCGIERQFDLYWEYELGGFTYKNIIECKDYEYGVPIEKVDALIGKMHDFPNIRAILATRVKYQDGAVKKAIAHNIDIIVVRDEDIEKDWKAPDGTPLVRTLKFDIKFILPVTIKRFQPILDKDWAIENNINSFHINDFANEIFINDLAKGIKISLYDYENSLKRNEGEGIIESTHVDTFENAFLETNTGRVKIKAIEIDYVAPPIRTTGFKMSPEVVGVVEYLNSDRKRMIINEKGSTIVKELNFD